ncbi:hypothetical protein [Acinetobacter sp. YH01009]|uniref:hypothetical protein n=1 Tax=Acinetobacter sp. YH01009 TaxID=2601025 RepID=UPI0015D20843|nr:hypothetical protein [Acinetobacter sp. YH01009]
MNNLKTLLKKDISLVHRAISDIQAKKLLNTYQVVESFSHFYESHSHIYLVGKDICAVMAKHFPYFAFKTRDNTKLRHTVGDGALSDILNSMRREYQIELYSNAVSKFISKVGTPEYKKSQSTSPVAYLIDDVMFTLEEPFIQLSPNTGSDFSDLFN